MPYLRRASCLFLASLVLGGEPASPAAPPGRFAPTIFFWDAAHGSVYASVIGWALYALDAASGRVRWRRPATTALWLEGNELLVQDTGTGDLLSLSTLDANTGALLRTCTGVPGEVPEPPRPDITVTWTATIDAAEGAPAGVVLVSWRREERFTPPERSTGSAPGGAGPPPDGPGVVGMHSASGAYQLDVHTCAQVPRLRGGRPLILPDVRREWVVAPSSAQAGGVVSTPDVTDAEGRRLPAYAWVRLDSSGQQIQAIQLDAGYRTRVIPSADGDSFAVVYARPDADRTVAWTLYGSAKGDRLGTVTPRGVGDWFLVCGGLLLVDRDSQIGFVAYDLASGSERWAFPATR
ncbi:MAG: hypothetical protein V4850_08050 [Myxococcota bacterium]